MNELTKREKAIVPIAACEARGDMEGLKSAIVDGVDNGLTVDEIKELLSGLYAYTGFPRSLNALGVLMRLAEEHQWGWTTVNTSEELPLWKRDGLSSLEAGTATQTRLSGAPVKGGVMDFAPSIDYYLKAHLFGDIFGVKTVSETDRELATLSALSALDGTEAQLRAHVRIAKNSGLTEGQIQSIPCLLKEKVGMREACRASRVIDAAMERKFCLEEPIDDVFPRGKVSTSDYFTGTVYTCRLVTPNKTSQSQISNVTFTAGARTRWHWHTGTQILLCTAGHGWYQEQGGQARPLKAGDVVVIAPETIHWHGASRDCEFSHISIIPNPEKNHDTWLEPVDEQQYQLL